jgi:hypothetical protein
MIYIKTKNIKIINSFFCSDSDTIEKLSQSRESDIYLSLKIDTQDRVFYWCIDNIGEPEKFFEDLDYDYHIGWLMENIEIVTDSEDIQIIIQEFKKCQDL